MKKCFAILTPLFFALVVFSAEGSLAVSVDEKWTLNHRRGDFYSFTRTNDESVLLMFSRLPLIGKREKIPVYLDQMAEGFLEKSKKSTGFSLATEEFTKEKIEGIEFTGEAVVFTIQGGFCQAMFMFGDGNQIWSGQFTGSEEHWAEALKILKQLKRNKPEEVIP